MNAILSPFFTAREEAALSANTMGEKTPKFSKIITANTPPRLIPAIIRFFMLYLPLASALNQSSPEACGRPLFSAICNFHFSVFTAIEMRCRCHSPKDATAAPMRIRGQTIITGNVLWACRNGERKAYCLHDKTCQGRVSRGNLSHHHSGKWPAVDPGRKASELSAEADCSEDAGNVLWRNASASGGYARDEIGSHRRCTGPKGGWSEREQSKGGQAHCRN